MTKAASKRYRAYIASQPCCVCGTDQAVDWHHVIGCGLGGMGMKAPDWATIPLCYQHHMGDNGIHKIGVITWQNKYGHQLEFLGRTLVFTHLEGKINIEVTA